jgi:CHAT domain-containing protein
VLSGRYPQLTQKIHELRMLRFQIGRKRLAVPGPEGLEEHERLLKDWESRRESLETELAGQLPEISLAEQLRVADHVTIAAAIPPGAALVEFAHVRRVAFTNNESSEATYLAFVVRPGDPPRVVLLDLGPAHAIDGLIGEFRSWLTRDEGTADCGERLRSRLVDPILAALAGARRLLLAPDGELSKLPFEVLPDGAGGRLIDHHEISYVGVGRDLLRFGRGPAPGAGPPLVVADPDFDLPGRADAVERLDDEPPVDEARKARHFFERLPGTRIEGEDVAARLGVAALMGGEALEARVKAASSPRILHFATHGFFFANPLQPTASGRLFGQKLENPLLRSGLALAGANNWLVGRACLSNEAEDGVLTAEDVTGLDLSATELVVLSACETGLGDIENGEGVFGLRRAFALAGARTLIMSLWKVPDNETQELMAEFYRLLTAGEPRVAALRQAQLAVRVRHPSPLCWGAFICQGEPGRLGPGS